MRVNGIMDEQPVVKKRRGRRKNVEGMDLLFMNRARAPTASDQVPPGWCGSSKASPAAGPALGFGRSHGPLDTDSRVPVLNLKDGTRLSGDDAPKRRDLEQWLREHPGFVADVRASIPGVNKMAFQDGRPKQKRHRCRNPNKIDVNSLTGEERVQIINRRNARKVGGASAPPLKDLCRFLQENPEYGVPPEWGDVVKQSGYLPESMFDRILTGPIVPEEVSRRGRRPKSAQAKAAGATALALNPLLANGLLSGLDLTSLQALQQNLQSLQSLQLTAGLMGLPGDASSLAAMFPMMLSGMAGLPNLLGLGGMLGKAREAGGEDGKKKGSSGRADGSAPGGPLHANASDAKGDRTEGRGAEPHSGDPSASHAPPTSALNPLLLSSMLYPGPLLPPGLNLPQPGAFHPKQQQGANSDPAPTPAPPSGKARPRGEHEEEEEESGEESAGPKENSGAEGSGKAESSSSESDSSSSSSEDSDSSDED